jgi:hypothetical protein
MGDTGGADSFTFTKVPLIPCEKLTETANYNIWAGAVRLWFHGQGLEDHLTKQGKDIATVHRTKWKQVDASPMHRSMVFNSTPSPSTVPSFHYLL